MRILGIDFSDANTIFASDDAESTLNLPTVICKCKDRNSFSVGEDAYQSVLDGTGILTDKLLSFAYKDGVTTLGEKKYTGTDLLKAFFKVAIDMYRKSLDSDYPEEVVISVPSIDKKLVEMINGIFVNLGYSNQNVHIISRAESFIYYVCGQNKEMRNNHVGMFSLSDVKLVYYEMKVQAKSRTTFVYADQESLDEGFNLDILNNPTGSKLADKVLLSCAERLMKNKIFSSIILTGKGFSSIDWAPNFMKYICTRRKVFVDEDLFARGSVYRGIDFAAPKPLFPIVCICDGRLDSSVYVDINKDNRNFPYPLVSIGDTWYNRESSIRLIPSGISSLDMTIIPIESRRRKVVHIPLDFLPKRPPKTTMIDVTVSFTNSHTMNITIKDAGFGELFPASSASITQEVDLWD